MFNLKYHFSLHDKNDGRNLEKSDKTEVSVTREREREKQGEKEREGERKREEREEMEEANGEVSRTRSVSWRTFQREI